MHGNGALYHELRDPKRQEARLARIAELEDRVFETAMGVIEATLAFQEVDFNQKDPPPEWIAQYGEEGARRRLNVAKAGWLPASHAPAAVKYSLQAAAGIGRMRGNRVQVSANSVNVKIQQITLPPPTSAAHAPPGVYAEKEIE